MKVGDKVQVVGTVSEFVTSPSGRKKVRVNFCMTDKLHAITICSGEFRVEDVRVIKSKRRLNERVRPTRASSKV